MTTNQTEITINREAPMHEAAAYLSVSVGPTVSDIDAATSQMQQAYSGVLAQLMTLRERRAGMGNTESGCECMQR